MLLIGGLQKFSLIDYPGKVAAVIFTQGCDFRCPFCHNPQLVFPERFCAHLEESDVLGFLRKRQGQLQGVVITGGEPTLHKDLPTFLRQIKALNFFVKLDTNGYHPKEMSSLLKEGLLDFIAMDVKAPLKKYSAVSGVSIDQDRIKQSVELIIKSGVDHQFRTTVVKSLLSEEDIEEISALIKGSRSYRLQPFIYQQEILDQSLMDKIDYTAEEFESLSKKFSHTSENLI